MRRIVWTVLMVSVIGVPMVFGQVGSRGRNQEAPGIRQGRGVMGLGMMTNLTQDQKDKIFAIEQNLRKDEVTLDSEADQIRYDLHKVMTASTIDEKKARELHTKLQAVLQKRADRHFQAQVEIHKVLTPAQRQQLQTATPGSLTGRGKRGKW